MTRRQLCCSAHCIRLQECFARGGSIIMHRDEENCPCFALRTWSSRDVCQKNSAAPKPPGIARHAATTSTCEHGCQPNSQAELVNAAANQPLSGALLSRRSLEGGS